MNYTESCKRIAAALAARPDAPLTIALTSSRESADCREAAKGIAGGFAAVGIEAVFCDATDGALPKTLADAGVSCGGPFSPAAAAALVAALREKHPAALLAVSCPRVSNNALLLLGAASAALLLEQKKLSRTDEIDETLAIIRNLGVSPAGFILQ